MTDEELKYWQLYIRQRVMIDPVTGCWNWQLYITPKGYGRAYYRSRSQRAHKLAYTVFVGPVPDGLQLRHQCHNNSCCNPAHLLVGTAQDNRDDDKRDGHQHGTAKLTAAQVAEIKRLLALRVYTHRQIGTMFGMSQQAIGNISRGQTWSHILPSPALPAFF